MTTNIDDAVTVEEAKAELADTLDGPNDAIEQLDNRSSPGYVVEPLPPELLDRVIEGAMLASGQPLSIQRIQALFEEGEIPAKDEVLAAFGRIGQACEGRGFELKEVASGWRFQVRRESVRWVNRLFDEKPQRYSRALLETLALIAYRQPITRGDIEEIRGVAVSSHIMKTLIEREWVKVVGHRDVPGRPSLYATTRLFLDYFNLSSLDQLPTLGEISDLESLNPELEFAGPVSAAGSQSDQDDVEDTECSTEQITFDADMAAGGKDLSLAETAADAQADLAQAEPEPEEPSNVDTALQENQTDPVDMAEDSPLAEKPKAPEENSEEKPRDTNSLFND